MLQCMYALIPRAVGAIVTYRMPHEEPTMPMHLMVNMSALMSLIAGILILLMPRLLNYIVAIYLIVIGILGLSR